MNLEKYLEWPTCVNCKKKFPRRIKSTSTGLRKKKCLNDNTEIRPPNTNSCSKKCARKFRYKSGHRRYRKELK